MITAKTDVVGSLLRPEFLKTARADREAGRLSPPEFKRIEDRAVDEAVALQEACRARASSPTARCAAPPSTPIWSNRSRGSTAARAGRSPSATGEGHEAQLERPVVVEKLKWRRQMCAEEFTYLRGRTRAPVKVTLLSAQQAAAYYDPDKSTRRLSRPATLISPISSTSRGARSPSSFASAASTCRSTRRSMPGSSTRRSARATASAAAIRTRCSTPTIELDNAIIAGHPGITFGIHICRGNHRSMFYASGGYDRIAEQVFSRAQLRSLPARIRRRAIGHVRAAPHVPDDRVVVLGLISSKTPRHGVRREPEGADRGGVAIVPLERLALSPQCGFASTHEGNALSEADQRQEAGARTPWPARCGGNGGSRFRVQGSVRGRRASLPRHVPLHRRQREQRHA